MKSGYFQLSHFSLCVIVVFQVMLGVSLSLRILSAGWTETDMCSSCLNAKFKCGYIIAGYPFWGRDRPFGCGHPDLLLYCKNNITLIDVLGVDYEVQDIQPADRTLRIRRQDFVNGFCNPQMKNTTLNHMLFIGPLDYNNYTIVYGCPSSIEIPSGGESVFCFMREKSYKDSFIRAGAIGPGKCSASVTFPIPTIIITQDNESLRHPIEPVVQTSVLSAAKEGSKRGFVVMWKEDSEACQKCNKHGACGFNIRNNQSTCYCPNQRLGSEECLQSSSYPPPPSHPFAPAQGLPSGKSRTQGSFDLRRKLIIGLTVAAASVMGLICIIYLTIFRNKGGSSSSENSRKLKENIDAFFKTYGSLAPNRYSRSDLKKMTNKFVEKLGEGGYGSVYKGKLADGRLVAVKVLSESKGNGEEFMNEVASISRTSHVNIVTLLGFCYDRSKRALVYEFMPHGSLDKFIYNQGSQAQSRQLEWKTLYDIALGIARGLEYLHQGCNTRILHFDIKPHNILLDENFCPKISDFGLSKLCERKESIISIAGARGTAGYIAPELFYRNFGGVSHKSDVYSYGMMILEMVGGRKNINLQVSKTSEVYFPSWIYKHLDHAMNLNLHGVTAEEEEEITRKLIMVSLWCVQTNPSDRPSMTKVLEMFQGSLQSLEIPPRPFVSSPVRSPKTASTT